jgi:hypothetical protein
MSSRAKKKKLDRLFRNNLNEGALIPEYVYHENPFGDIPLEKRKSIFKEISHKIEEEEFPKKINELKDFIKNTEPIHLLCFLSYYFLTAPVDDFNRRLLKNNISQFHVELLQTFILSLNNEEYKELQPLSPYKVEYIIDLLTSIADFYTYLLFNRSLEPSEKENKYLSFIISGLRIHTFSVRNWAYPNETKTTLKKIFAPINDVINKDTGINILSLIELFEELVSKIESKINHHKQRVNEIFRLNDKAQIIGKYLEFFPNNNSFEELLEFSRKFSSRKDFKLMLLAHSDLFLAEKYAIDCSSIIDKYYKEFNKISEVLANLTCEIGDLSTNKFEHVYLDNPIWNKPFVRGFDNKIYYPIPALFQHTNFQVIESLLTETPHILKSISKRKSEFLEDEIEVLFLKAFPSAKVCKNLIWKNADSDKIYETDILVMIDTAAIIIEAKSGKFSDSAKRGSVLRIKDEIKTFILEPTEQINRFVEFINNNLTMISLKSQRGAEYHLDFSKVTRIIRLCITLEYVPIISSCKRDLLAAGLIVDKIQIPTTMSLNDLNIVLELLESSSEKIHYLYRRSELEANANIEGDELDLLTFYLETGFNIGEDEFSDQIMILRGASEKLDNYYVGRNYAENLPKPIPRRSKFWKDTILKLEERKFYGWSEIAYIFLNVIYEDQIKIEHAIQNQSKYVYRNWGMPNLKNSIILLTGPSDRQNMIIWFLYRDIPKNERDVKVKAIVSKEMEEYDISRVLVFGLNIDKPIYPYSFIAIMDSLDSFDTNSVIN